MIMKKTWNVLTWILIVAAQLIFSYWLVSYFTADKSSAQIETMSQFSMIPLIIWVGYVLVVYGLGMLGLLLYKFKPARAGLRFLSTAIMTAIPMLILIFNAQTVGLGNRLEFQHLVMDRMIPYYTQLGLAFALLGFYITVWWQKAPPRKTKQ
jgi:heme/copper-type cytochrome/quinol oxidase subunit 3